MIEQFAERCALQCRGGFIAYYNDMNLYAPDPAQMLSRAIALLICADGPVLISRADLTLEENAVRHAAFSVIDRALFARRSTGALFAQGRYFSISSGEFAGSYQISDDLILNEAFSCPRDYRRYLLSRGEM